jgi:membrane protein YdbS with pleckstrin-like domain
MITAPDFINAAFEALASVFVLNHARMLWKSRQGFSVSILSTIFFAIWGMWNVWYYPHLGQWFSFWAGIAVMISNFIWIFVIWHVRRYGRMEVI